MTETTKMSEQLLKDTIFLSQQELDEIAIKANDTMTQTAGKLAKSAAADARNNAPRHEPPEDTYDCWECSSSCLMM